MIQDVDPRDVVKVMASKRSEQFYPVFNAAEPVISGLPQSIAFANIAGVTKRRQPKAGSAVSSASFQPLRIIPLSIAMPCDPRPRKKRFGKKIDAKSRSKKGRTGRKMQ